MEGDFTIGIEEEMFLVDAETMDCVLDMPDGFRLEAERRLGSHFEREMAASMIELVSGCHASLARLEAEQCELRGEAAAIARRHGLALMASGTHPFADWTQQSVAPKPRYAEIAEAIRLPSIRSHACGLHIHVGTPDGTDRVALMGRMRPYLPLFLALSTSSPFWRGRLMGVKSYRTLVNNELPRSGLPAHFRDETEYRALVSTLTEAGAIPDESYLWWAIRPSRNFPTLELRISDCCTDLDDAIALTGLYRALAHHLCSLAVPPDRPDARADIVLDENRWQAARLGTAASLVAPSGEPRNLTSMLHEICETMRESLDLLAGDDTPARLERILREGTSADRQEMIYRQEIRAGRLEGEAVAAVAEHLVAATSRFSLDAASEPYAQS